MAEVVKDHRNTVEEISIDDAAHEVDRESAKQATDEISLAGIEHGLELMINLEVSEYMTGTAEIGALVMIHPPSDYGSASEAIFVAPQRTTYIGLKMITISRLPTPYPEHCDDVWPTELQASLTLNTSYSQQTCLKICLQRTMLKVCQCQSAKLPSVEFNNTNPRICDTRRRRELIKGS